ncbi:MAG TPA: DUF2169 domain-containing protein [Rhizobacter sp.]|nr:DUF2169 domain-containing protein [Rhizobacter sp.]
MELINATRMTAGYSVAVEPSGRELLVVVIKGTFALPRPGEPVRLHDEQLPLVMADCFTGEPGASAPLSEVDFAPRKQACDVLLMGSAHAPQGRLVTRQRVELRVGTMHKSFDVVGNRVWQAGVTGITASEPEHFARMPVSYDLAFGGLDQHGDDAREHDAYVDNPVGRGWHRQLKNAWVDGTPLPNTEEAGQPVKFPSDRYRPMALGPLGRGWPSRARYAGTYDERWMAEAFPFLPADFDERYYQAAPIDQQLPLPREPLPVVLNGFTPDGPREFTLPHFEAPVHVFPRRGAREEHKATLDTIAFEPDSERFTMSWRLCRPLAKSIHEIGQVMVGKKGREWWQQRDTSFPIPVVMIPVGKPSAQKAPDGAQPA